MKLIFCLDKKKGLSLFGKRQSQDGQLRATLMELIAPSPLWMNAYTATQFGEFSDRIKVSETFLTEAGEEEFCFVETPLDSLEGATEVILCHWDRQYPADGKFTFDLKDLGFGKTSSQTIQGSSHDKITIERYEKNA